MTWTTLALLILALVGIIAVYVENRRLLMKIAGLTGENHALRLTLEEYRTELAERKCPKTK